MTEGDELAMQAQWIDLREFIKWSRYFDELYECKEALDEPAAVLPDRRPA